MIAILTEKVAILATFSLHLETPEVFAADDFIFKVVVSKNFQVTGDNFLSKSCQNSQN